MQLAPCLLMVLAAATASGEDRFQWEVPGALESVSVPGATEAAGYPVQMRAVKSSLRFEPLLEHFARSFVKAGLYVAPFDKQAQGFREVRLTGLDTGRQIAYTVFFQPNPDQTTTVVLTEAELGQRNPSPGAGELFAPVFPEAAKPLVSRLEGARSLVYTVTGAGAEEVQRFYRDTLGRAGYVERSPGAFGRDDEELQVMVTARRGGPGVVVAVISRAP
ncbi:MAG: hypothetical protein ACYC8T_35450 [Myxococcaceae bacterium]